jgi:methylglutaconyl-CoA hydratase
MPLEEALNFAAEMNARARSSDECQKGIRAFLDKQKIAW